MHARTLVDSSSTAAPMHLAHLGGDAQRAGVGVHGGSFLYSGDGGRPICYEPAAFYALKGCLCVVWGW